MPARKSFSRFDSNGEAHVPFPHPDAPRFFKTHLSRSALIASRVSSTVLSPLVSLMQRIEIFEVVPVKILAGQFF